MRWAQIYVEKYEALLKYKLALLPTAHEHSAIHTEGLFLESW